MIVPDAQPSPSKKSLIGGWILFAVAAIAVVSFWANASTTFYEQVIPFYDSLSYQEGYLYTTQSINADGPIDRLLSTWRQSGNNVVLYKFFAALFGELLPHPKAGLYVYLFSIHILATAALFHTIWKFNGSLALALLAIAVWWSTTPFSLLRDGIGDQRLDLSSGSFFLLFAACGLNWLKQPSLRMAAITGMVTAFAMLHRPVMAALLGGVGLILFIAAKSRHEKAASRWTLHLVVAAAPIALIALPWLLTHFNFLRTYYTEYGVDIGRDTMAQAASFNLHSFADAFGVVATVGLVASWAYGLMSRKLDRGIFTTVILVFVAPLLLLTLSRAIGNIFAAQMALAIPVLSLAALSGPSRRDRPSDSLATTSIAALLLLAAVVATPFRLQTSLAQERPNARPEVEAVLNQIATIQPQARMAGFHDQPANIGSFAAIARDAQLALTAGTVAFHPYDFGLTAEEAQARDPQRIHTALSEVLTKVKQSNEILVLPTPETENRLWAGLFSHQMIPQLRSIIESDTGFALMGKSSPIDGVEFNIYRCEPSP